MLCNNWKTPVCRAWKLWSQTSVRGLRGKIANPYIPPASSVSHPGKEAFEEAARDNPYPEYTEEQKAWYWKKNPSINDPNDFGGLAEHQGLVWPREAPYLEPKYYKKDDPNRVDPEAEPFRQVYAANEGVNDDGSFSKAEIVSDPSVWFWVQRVLPKKDLPNYPRTDNRERMPSGWIPPPLTPPNKTYFVARTRGGVFPVYKRLVVREKVHVRRLDQHVMEQKPDVLTVVLRVDGQLRDLEWDLLQTLEKKTGKKVLSAVDELSGKITFKGNHVEDVVRFLEENGF